MVTRARPPIVLPAEDREVIRKEDEGSFQRGRTIRSTADDTRGGARDRSRP
jgi:hypothetical protein